MKGTVLLGLAAAAVLALVAAAVIMFFSNRRAPSVAEAKAQVGVSGDRSDHTVDSHEPPEAREPADRDPAKFEQFIRNGKLEIPRFAYVPKVGDIGYLPKGTSVSQRLDNENEALVLVPYTSRRQPPFPSRMSPRQLSAEIQRRASMGPVRELREVYVRGFNFSKLVDGQAVTFDVPFEVVGTETFATVHGGRKTVHVMSGDEKVSGTFIAGGTKRCQLRPTKRFLTPLLPPPMQADSRSVNGG